MSKELFSLADKIKLLRENSGLTQAGIARQLGISRSGVNAWEMGLSVPSTQYIVELAKTFGVSTDFLLGINIYYFCRRIVRKASIFFTQNYRMF